MKKIGRVRTTDGRFKSEERTKATELGEKSYFSIRPCKKGHLSERYTSSGQCMECARQWRTTWKEEDPVKYIYQSARSNAERKNIPFKITIEDLREVYPSNNLCPVLGIPMKMNLGQKHMSDNSPSIDKFDPSMGYVKGNVFIISFLANRIKSNLADSSILRKIADWMDSKS